MVSQLGPYSHPYLLQWCMNTDYFTGFNNIFETKKFILLEPVSSATDGYFWIDKATNTGIRIPSNHRLDLVGRLFLEGKQLFRLSSVQSMNL